MAKDRIVVSTAEESALPFCPVGIGPSISVTTILDTQTGETTKGSGFTAEQSLANAMTEYEKK